MQILSSVDLAKNELRNARVQNLGSEPASPVAGQIYFNTTDSTFYYYDGTAWIGSGTVNYAPVGDITTIQPDDTASAGVSSNAARGDHRHAIAAAVPGSSAVGDGASEGTSGSFARADHKHGRESFGAVSAETTFGGVSANGVNTTLARSDHQHGTPAHGAAAHSGISLSDLAAPTADISIGTHKLINLLDPTNPQDAVTKAYVDATAQGMDVKESVRAATVTNIDLAAQASRTVDGASLSSGDRVLVKNQTTASENGVYVVQGDFSLIRAEDFDENAEVTSGAFMFVEEGTDNADSGWVLTTDGPITVGTTALSFSQFSGAGQIEAGAGLTKSGNKIDVIGGDGVIVTADLVSLSFADAESGAVSPTGGSVGVGTQVAREDHSHDASVAAPTGNIAPDGTNSAGTANTLARSDHLHAAPAGAPTGTLSPGSTNAEGTSPNFSRSDHTHALDASIPRKYSTNVGDGVATAITVTHNLGTRDVQVSVYEVATPYAEVLCDVEHATTSAVTLRFAIAPTTDQYRAVVVG